MTRIFISIKRTRFLESENGPVLAEITTNIVFKKKRKKIQRKQSKMFKTINEKKAFLMCIILVKLKNVHEFLSMLAAMPKALVRNQVIKTLFFQSDELCPAATKPRHFSQGRRNLWG